MLMKSLIEGDVELEFENLDELNLICYLYPRVHGAHFPF